MKENVLTITKKPKKILYLGINNTPIEIFIDDYNIYIFVDNVEILCVDKKNENFSLFFKDLLFKCLKGNNKIDIKLSDNKSGNFIFEKIKNDIPNIEFKIRVKIRNKKQQNYELSNKEIIEGLKNFIQEVTAIEETLRICREDLMRLSLNKSFNTIWGSKEILNKIKNLLTEIVENKSWEEVEFYTNLLVRYVRNSIYYLDNLNKEEIKELLTKKTVPNIKANFDRLKRIISGAALTLLKFLELCKFISNYTKYPINFFINNSLLEDLKYDYDNLINFIIKIPIFERIFEQLSFVKD